MRGAGSGERTGAEKSGGRAISRSSTAGADRLVCATNGGLDSPANGRLGLFSAGGLAILFASGLAIPFAGGHGLAADS